MRHNGARSWAPRPSCVAGPPCLLLFVLWALIHGSQAARLSPGAPARRLLSATSGTPSTTGPAMEQLFVIRFSGPSFVPFTRKHQDVLVQALEEVLLPKEGPARLITYREALPDAGGPANTTERFPYVDLSGYAYYLLEPNSTMWQPDLQLLLQAASRVFELGNWSRASHNVRLLALLSQRIELDEPVVLRPIVVLNVVLAVQPGKVLLEGKGNVLPSEQASLLAQSVGVAAEACATQSVAIERNASLVKGMLSAPLDERYKDHGLVLLEVTMLTCDPKAAPTPDCELRDLQKLLDQLVASEAAQQEWASAGMHGVEVASVYVRPTPQPAKAPPAHEGQQPRGWVPWHLDRLDQRSMPLDGQFQATAAGTDVNVYLVASGVRADHKEFGYLDGRPGTRIQPFWGYNGLDPMEDCVDSFAWYGFGTFAASVIGGLTVGVAKNTTIHSVRFRGSCLMDDQGSFTPAGMPAAIANVAQNHTKPALLVIDSWWRPDRFAFDDDAVLEKSLNDSLDLAAAANITVIVGVSTRACENVLAKHPGVIAVATSDVFDGSLLMANSSCIDFFAPGGGLGTGITGADPTGPTEYKNVMPLQSGGMAVAAGVAAQYLSLHPNASAAEVREALVRSSTPHTVMMAGTASPTLLLYSSFRQPPGAPEVVQPTDILGLGKGSGSQGNGTLGGSTGQQSAVGAGADSGSSSGGSSSVPIVAIVVPIIIVVVAMVAFAFFVVSRRRRQHPDYPPSPEKVVHEPAGPEWEIKEDQIEISKHSDGSDWLIGEGSYGQVYRAIKGGVQVVAVKKLHGRYMDGPRRELFIQEIALMKYVSRDANITQFYGACISPSMMLVVEYMEGGDLRRALTADRSGDLGWYRLGKSIALDILRGLHFLHANGVIHRDIKSKNILLTREGRAKIADVGLAQVLEEEQYKVEGLKTHQDRVLGTFAWAAPELLLGEACTDKVDIYSFGVVLWEIVTQEVPIRGCLHEPSVPLQCPQAVADAIQACLKRDAAQRPTARELYSRLQACAPNDDIYATHNSSLKFGGFTPGHSPAPSYAHSGPNSSQAYLPQGSMGSSNSSGGAEGSCGPLLLRSYSEHQHRGGELRLSSGQAAGEGCGGTGGAPAAGGEAQAGVAEGEGRSAGGFGQAVVPPFQHRGDSASLQEEQGWRGLQHCGAGSPADGQRAQQQQQQQQQEQQQQPEQQHEPQAAAAAHMNTALQLVLDKIMVARRQQLQQEEMPQLPSNPRTPSPTRGS